MADTNVVAYYKSWRHELNRANDHGKTNYAGNCQIELTRLEGLYPELVGEKCTCGVYTGCK